MKIKKEYRGGAADIIIWRKKEDEKEGSHEYIVTYNQQGTGMTAERFLEMQVTPDSEVVGIFYGVNERGGKAVSDLLFRNMLKGRLEVLTPSELEDVLCEPA